MFILSSQLDGRRLETIVRSLNSFMFALVHLAAKFNREVAYQL